MRFIKIKRYLINIVEWKDEINWNGGGLGSSPAGIPLIYLWMEDYGR